MVPAASWLSLRLAEPSTRICLMGLAAMISAIVTHPPVSSADWVTIGIGSLGGLLGIATPAPGSADAKPAS